MTQWVRASLVLLLLAAGPALGQSEEELDALRERIEESRVRVEGHELAERDVFDQLEGIDRRRAKLAGAVRGARVAANQAGETLERVAAEAEALAEGLAVTQRAMSRRAVALYKTGGAGPLRLVFASDSLRELLQRAEALEQLLSYDADLVARYQRERGAHEAKRVEAERATLRRQESLATLKAERSLLARERESKRAFLDRVQKDRRVERALLAELEAAAQALETALAELGEGGRDQVAWLAGAGFAARKGRLPLPVEGPLVAPFGPVVDADFLTRTHRNGVELGAAQGDDVVAVARGVVRFAGWFRGYGKIVILDHGDGYFTVSGHLSELRVSVDERVEEGDPIGFAGETGSLAGPRLYFELRRGGVALDPSGWLSAGRFAEAR